MFSLIRSLARPLLALIFVTGGLDTSTKPGGRAQAAASLGLPQPELAVRVNGLTMLIAGAAFALGILPEWAAVVLAGSLVPTTLAGHPFWKETDPQKRAGQRIHFLKNVAMIGGLLLAAAEENQARKLAKIQSVARGRSEKVSKLRAA